MLSSKMLLVFVSGLAAFSLSGEAALADQNTAPTDGTNVQGSAFQDSFVSGYSYARVYGSGSSQRAVVTIGDGIMDDCGIVKDGPGAQIKFREPTTSGIYTKSPATYYEPGTPGRTFSLSQITIISVTGDTVYGSVRLVSVNGLIEGPFAAPICR